MHSGPKRAILETFWFLCLFHEVIPILKRLPGTLNTGETPKKYKARNFFNIQNNIYVRGAIKIKCDLFNISSLVHLRDLTRIFFLFICSLSIFYVLTIFLSQLTESNGKALFDDRSADPPKGLVEALLGEGEVSHSCLCCEKLI